MSIFKILLLFIMLLMGSITVDLYAQCNGDNDFPGDLICVNSQQQKTDSEEALILENTDPDLDSAYLSPTIPQTTPVQLAGSGRAVNPYSRAIGERIAGWVVLGTSLLNFLIAVPYGRWVDDMNAEIGTSGGLDGSLCTGLIFAEGGIRAAIGGAMLGIGYYRHSRWKRWKNEHSSINSDFRGLSLQFDF